jgi:alkanesulfonate monooxygenase SsuD/methylene tetrahydromethanopterin reductase-like flavin-dependent oxidoreductase (luciferase family)
MRRQQQQAQRSLSPSLNNTCAAALSATRTCAHRVVCEEREMQFGLFGGARASTGGDRISDSQVYVDYIDYVREAEELGFRSIFLVEHHFTGLGQISATLSFLNFLAAKTHRIRLGTAVVVLPWHNPALLVEQAATLDLLSGGRFDFGIGKGYRQNEFDGFCIPIAEASERYEETLQFILRAWSERVRFSHHGKYWHFDDIVVEPSPVQKPHPPIWVGAGSARSIEAAAQQGFNILLAQHGSPEDVAAKVDVYRSALKAAGREYKPHSVGVTRALHVTMNDRERDTAHALRMKYMQSVQDLALKGGPGSGYLRTYSSPEDFRKATETDALIGTPDEIVERVHRYQSLGIDYILAIDLAGSVNTLRTFGREVMPAFAADESASAVPTQSPALAK